MKRIEQIAQRFDQASATYEGAAELQWRAAQSLACKVLETPWEHPKVLEIGCGTGYLTQLLLPRIPGQWLVTDIAPSMVQATRNRFSASAAQFRLLDGSNPDLPAQSVDLIVSNLAAQWFEDLRGALHHLACCLTPGGRLLLTLLGRESLSQWRAAVADTGHQAGTPTFPTAQSLAGMLPQSRVSAQCVTLSYHNARVYLNSLKAIGASLPAPDYAPLPASVMRRAMQLMGEPCAVSYEILTLDWVKP